MLKSPSPTTKEKEAINPKHKHKKDHQPTVSFDNENTNDANKDKDKVHMFGTLRVRLKRLVEQIQEVQVAKSPVIEIDVKVMPKFIASFNSVIYFCDDEGNLVIAEFRSPQIIDSFQIKSIQKLNVSGVRGLAVNKKYLAISFVDANKIMNDPKQRQRAKPESGICLYKINESIIQFDKVIDKLSQKTLSFIAPNGITLNSDHNLFVCDRELHAIFKFDAKSGNLLQKVVLTNEQEPSGVSLLLDNPKHLIYSDSLRLDLNLVETGQFSQVKSVKLTDDYNLSFNEPFDVVTSLISAGNAKENGAESAEEIVFGDSSLVFVKHRTDSKILVYDTNLNLKYSFEYEHSNGQGINYLRLNGKHDFLLMGYSNGQDTADNKTRFKLGIFSDF